MPSLPAAIPTLPDPGAASAPRLPGPRPACLPRLALAAALALVWGAPMLWITITAPRMVEIFREFGAPQEPLTATALRLGNALASPLGLVGLVVFL
ncbi:MAG: hypothetical protein K2Q09_01310, partial [Phycisphaerales bacterium]|nr:hypothetical protein [Phycisphaerales bacterium]